MCQPGALRDDARAWPQRNAQLRGMEMGTAEGCAGQGAGPCVQDSSVELGWGGQAVMGCPSEPGVQAVGSWSPKDRQSPSSEGSRVPALPSPASGGCGQGRAPVLAVPGWLHPGHPTDSTRGSRCAWAVPVLCWLQALLRWERAQPLGPQPVLQEGRCQDTPSCHRYPQVSLPQPCRPLLCPSRGRGLPCGGCRRRPQPCTP